MSQNNGEQMKNQQRFPNCRIEEALPLKQER